MIFSLILLALKNQMCVSRRLIWRVIQVLAFAALSCGVHLWITQACNAALGVSDYRSGNVSASVLWENLGRIGQDLKYVLLESYHLMPEYVYIGCLTLLGAGLAAELILSKRFGMLAFGLAALIGCLSMPFSLHAISGDYQMDRAMRTMIALFALPCIPGVWLMALPERPRVRMAVPAAGILLLMLLLSSYSVQQYSVDLSNKIALDRQRAKAVLAQIEDYQNQTGVTVRKAAAVADTNPTYYVDYIKFGRGDEDPFRPAFVNDWWDIFVILNYYGGSLEWAGEMPEEIYRQYFAGKDWDHFIPEEQMIFVGDTLYMAVY